MKLTSAQRALLADRRLALPRVMPANAFAVYTLSDPTTGAVRYVGVTQRPRARFLEHFKHRILRGEKQRWLEQLAAQDQLPIMTIVEVFSGTPEEAQRHEIEWITRLSREGATLLNRETWQPSANTSYDDTAHAHDEQSEEVLLPVEQFFVPLFGKSVLGVHLDDGRLYLALRWLCEALRLNTSAQVQRIMRKTALRTGLVRIRIQTNGGPQVIAALELDIIPGWILSIDEHRVAPDLRQQVIALQREAVQVLFNRSGLADWQTSTSIASLPIGPEGTARLVPRASGERQSNGRAPA